MRHPRLAESVISGDLPEPISLPFQEQAGELHDLIAVSKPVVSVSTMRIFIQKYSYGRCEVLHLGFTLDPERHDELPRDYSSTLIPQWRASRSTV